MEITTQELLQGKSTIIKNKEFFPTKTYVEPFLDKMSAFTDDFKVQVKVPDQMTLTKDSTDLTFNRVLIEAKLPESHCIDNHDEVIGFLYGLDVRKPVVKIYRSMENRACTNMCVFDPQWLQVQELVPGDPINYNAIQNLMELTSNFKTTLESMKKTFVDREDRKLHLGTWVDHVLRDGEDYGYGKVKIATGAPIKAYQQLYINQDSEYYIPEGQEASLFDVYNSFTQILTDDKSKGKDLMNNFEKTMIINRLLGVGGN